jgi:hypothetical protein
MEGQALSVPVLAWSGTLREGSIKWAAFARIASTPEQIYFSWHRRAATIIPRRAFASPEDAEALLQAAAHWHAAARSSTGRPEI